MSASSVTLWAVILDGEIDEDSVRPTESEAIAAFDAAAEMGGGYRYLRRCGRVNVVQVVVSEVDG